MIGSIARFRSDNNAIQIGTLLANSFEFSHYYCSLELLFPS